MANTETYGKYLKLSSKTSNSISVMWSSMGVSGNIVTDPYYNLEIFKYPESSSNLIFGSHSIPLSARSWTFSSGTGANLQPNTWYVVKLYANRQTDRAVDRLEVLTDSASNPIPTVPSVNLSASGRTINISGVTGIDTYSLAIRVNDVLVKTISVYPSASYSTTYTGNYNTYYKVNVEPQNSYGSGPSATAWIWTDSVPTPSAPTNFRIYGQGETYAQFAWNAAIGATSHALEIWRGSSRVYSDYNITNTSHTANGLSVDVDYQAKLYGINAGGNGTPVYLNFRLGYDRPQDFAWTTVKARGRSYNLANGRYTNLISRTEVVNLQTRINDFRRYKGLSPYPFTSPATGAVFTAALYNELNDAIAGMSPPTSVPGRKSSGTANLPALLNGLVTALNSL